jgi:hypothetical protein
MRLIQSARLNGHDPSAYLRAVLTRLPTRSAPVMLPHRWQASTTRATDANHGHHLVVKMTSPDAY